MEIYQACVIKSFKHDGHLHRMWTENWLIPSHKLVPEHAAEAMLVLINEQTPIHEAGGQIWVSKVPAVSFFMPGLWFNVVALLEEPGIRYYCNVASPPYLNNNVLTYIDYDLDVIRTADGSIHVVDREEYEQHKALYHYPKLVENKVMQGLNELTYRIRTALSPFNEEVVYRYYHLWKNEENGVQE